jgi:cytochrome c biogenesis protein CcdA/thiol-disulfide isomerase/thioredoxin
MLFLIIMAFLSGVATVLSPCILPILPIMLSGAVGGKRKPYGIIVGFVLSFAIFTVFATALVQSLGIDLDVLRYVAAVILALLGLTLLFPQIQEKINVLVKTPRLQAGQREGFRGGLATGATLGLVWAPCAGPILAAVITLAATAQAGIGSFMVVLSYALGTGVVMLLIILGSRRILEKVKKLYTHLETIHKVFGILVIIAALGIATGYDRKVQIYIIDVTPASWTTFLQSFEQGTVVDSAIESLDKDTKGLNINGGQAPELIGVASWINSDGESIVDLKGKVVLIDFWTYSCINCIRTLPHLKDWHEKYSDDGLVIIGVHSPEFAFEKKFSNVEKAVEDFGLEYPIALDNDFSTWRAYNNKFWPAKYFIDREGNIQHTQFGEGNYKNSEEMIRQLLAEGGDMPEEELSQPGPAPYSIGQSPETYLGYWRLAKFENLPELSQNSSYNYQLAGSLSNNEWTIGGHWRMEEKRLISEKDGSRLKMKFSGKNVFLVMGSPTSKQVEVLIDGQTAALSPITVDEFKLYDVIKDNSFIKGGILELVVPEGVELYAFTFGS